MRRSSASRSERSCSPTKKAPTEPPSTSTADMTIRLIRKAIPSRTRDPRSAFLEGDGVAERPGHAVVERLPVHLGVRVHEVVHLLRVPLGEGEPPAALLELDPELV